MIITRPVKVDDRDRSRYAAGTGRYRNRRKTKIIPWAELYKCGGNLRVHGLIQINYQALSPAVSGSIVTSSPSPLSHIEAIGEKVASAH